MILELLESTVTQGFIYALLTCGIYITYKLLDFPDLSVDGSFPLGAAVTAVMLTKGVNACGRSCRSCHRAYPCKAQSS